MHSLWWFLGLIFFSLKDRLFRYCLRPSYQNINKYQNIYKLTSFLTSDHSFIVGIIFIETVPNYSSNSQCTIWVYGILNQIHNWWLFYLYATAGTSWSWSYDSWIYNYLCNRCLSPLTLWVRIPFRRGVFDTTLCDNVCQWLAAGQWFSPGTPVSSNNKTGCHCPNHLYDPNIRAQIRNVSSLIKGRTYYLHYILIYEM